MNQIDLPIVTIDAEIPSSFGDLDQDAALEDKIPVEQTKSWMRQVLRRFEERYGMTSREFYTRWLQDDIEDTYETTFWASLCRYQQWANT